MSIADGGKKKAAPLFDRDAQVWYTYRGKGFLVCYLCRLAITISIIVIVSFCDPEAANDRESGGDD